VTSPWSFLLDPPDFPAASYAPLADRIASLLGTRSDIVFVQAEAVLALEAVAASVSRPGLMALNLVTSAYGTTVGAWLRRGGADVHDLVAKPGQPIPVSAVASALDALPRVDIVAWTHGETSTGIVNPLDEIAARARAKGALSVVDAVASAGGHKLDLDAVDIAVIGPQKALAGPAGVSMVSCSDRAWAHIEGGAPPDASLLSLAGIKRDWIDRGRGALPGMPPPLEFWALDAAISRAEKEGIESIVLRHQRAAMAMRAGLRALGMTLWVKDDVSASTLATTIELPPGLDADALVRSAPDFGVRLNHAGAPMRGRLLRFDHIGLGASAACVLASVAGFGGMLRLHAQIGAAVEQVDAAYRKEGLLF
jgi:aspartate aminotransferase-like enzyme